MADQNQFWQKVGAIDSNEKLRALWPAQLYDYREYFVEVQYIPTLPPLEKDAAANHLGRLQDELNRRRNRNMFVLTASGIVIVILFGVFQCPGNSRPASPPPAQASVAPSTTSTVQKTTTAPMAVELQSAKPQASPTPSETETPIKLPPPAP